MNKFSIVIPCYNEEDNIFSLFDRLQELINIDEKIEIIIVENGSTDLTLTNIKKHSLYNNNIINLVVVEKNLGYGHGIMSGVYHSKSEYIAWCHADLQIDPLDVYNAYKHYKYELFSGKAIIKGKRKGRNIIDKFLTACMSLVVSILFKFSLSDINAQPKIFPKKYLNLLKEYPQDFSLDLYFLIIAKINNYEILEYPVNLKKRVAGLSKGGESFTGKIKLIYRTFFYIYKTKKKLNKKWK